MSDIIQYFNVKERGVGRGKGMTIGRAGKGNEEEISGEKIMEMNLLKGYKEIRKEMS